MEVHFIYVNKPKCDDGDLKFTFYYLCYFQIPEAHPAVVFTLTIADLLQMVSSRTDAYSVKTPTSLYR